MKHFPETTLPGSEPSKKRKKKPTGILKDLLELKKYELFKGNIHTRFSDLVKEPDDLVRWSDVEAIINKYLNP
jgi:hypothetical protein